MNYDTALQAIITALKDDKSVVQPWRNKAASRLEEVQAFIDRGKKVTYRKPEEMDCNCPIGGKRFDCPVHGS